MSMLLSLNVSSVTTTEYNIYYKFWSSFPKHFPITMSLANGFKPVNMLLNAFPAIWNLFKNIIIIPAMKMQQYNTQSKSTLNKYRPAAVLGYNSLGKR